MPPSLVYGHDKAQYKLDVNPLYEHFNDLFVKVFNDPDSPAMHLECYCPVPAQNRERLRPLLTDTRVLEDPALGEHECDLYNYAMTGTPPFLLLLGSVGFGKTTVLKNFLYLTKEKYPLLGKDILPIRINMNAEKAKLEQAYRVGGIEAVKAAVIAKIYSELFASVRRRLTDRERYARFKAYAWEHAAYLQKYAPELSSLEEEFSAASEQTAAFRLARWQAFMEDPSYPRSIVQFLRECEEVRVLVLIDNIDPLGIEIHESLIWLAKELGESVGVKVVVSMRHTTLRALRRRFDALRLFVLQMRPPDVKGILERRIKYLLQQLERRHAEQAYQVALRKALDLEPEEANAALNAMIDVTLSDETLRQLATLSNGNARAVQKFLHVYFRSGYFHSDVLMIKIRQRMRKGLSEKQIPSHVFVQSIVTDNHYTYFEQPPYEGITNIWCDASAHFPWSHFSQMYLLSFIRSHTQSNPEIKFSGVHDAVRRVFATHPCLGYWEQHLPAMVARLIRAKLLETPEFYAAPEHDRIEPDTILTMAPCGACYLDGFAICMEYFSHVKDHIQRCSADAAYSCFEEDGRPNSHPKYNDHFRFRFDETTKAIDYLFQQEHHLLQSLQTVPSTWEGFKNEMCPRHEGRNVMLSYTLASRHRKLRFEHEQLLTLTSRREIERIDRLFERTSLVNAGFYPVVAVLKTGTRRDGAPPR